MSGRRATRWSIFSLLGLLLPIYTITGYDASAHTSEETYKAAHSVPRGIVHSVLWSALVRLGHGLRHRDRHPGYGGGRQAGLERVLRHDDHDHAELAGASFCISFIFIAQFLCGLATVTSASRMIFAFSRDGGLPFISKWVVEGQPQIPHAGGGDLDGRCARIAVRLDGADGVDRRDQHLHHRGELDADLPVPVVHRADRARLLCHRHGRNGRRWGRGTSAFRCIGCSPCCRCFAWCSSSTSPCSRRTTRCFGSRWSSWCSRPSSGSVREQALPGSADGRDDREAPGRDPGGGEGRRRNLTLAKVA